MSTTMAEDVAEARRRVAAVIAGDVQWACPHCDGTREHYLGDWWQADHLREAAGIDGPVGMIAVNEMVRDGELELDSKLRIRAKQPVELQEALR